MPSTPMRVIFVLALFSAIAANALESHVDESDRVVPEEAFAEDSSEVHGTGCGWLYKATGNKLIKKCVSCKHNCETRKNIGRKFKDRSCQKFNRYCPGGSKEQAKKQAEKAKAERTAKAKAKADELVTKAKAKADELAAKAKARRRSRRRYRPPPPSGCPHFIRSTYCGKTCRRCVPLGGIYTFSSGRTRCKC